MIYDSYVECIKKQFVLTPEEWSFKSDPDYRAVLEWLSPYDGYQYLDTIRSLFLFFFQQNYDFLIELCNINDKYGKTEQLYFENFTICSGSNLRYILHSVLILEDMRKYGLTEVDIIEIGGGYGGLCFFMHKISKLYNIKINSYSIFDLEEASQLQKLYLETLGIENVNVCQLYNYNNLKKDSFLISNYAFSEIDVELQKMYSRQIINPYTKFGFLTWNGIESHKFVENKNIKYENEYPQTGDINYYVRYCPK